MTRYKVAQFATALAVAAVGTFAIGVRCGEALLDWISPR